MTQGISCLLLNLSAQDSLSNGTDQIAHACTSAWHSFLPCHSLPPEEEPGHHGVHSRHNVEHQTLADMLCWSASSRQTAFTLQISALTCANGLETPTQSLSHCFLHGMSKGELPCLSICRKDMAWLLQPVSLPIHEAFQSLEVCNLFVALFPINWEQGLFSTSLTSWQFLTMHWKKYISPLKVCNLEVDTSLLKLNQINGSAGKFLNATHLYQTQTLWLLINRHNKIDFVIILLVTLHFSHCLPDDERNQKPACSSPAHFKWNKTFLFFYFLVIM